MDSQLDILVDIVAALCVALAGGWLAARVKLSPVFGYVIAGLVIGPFTPGFVGDTDRLRLLADIGVVLLLFGMGVKFSVRDLLQAGRTTASLATLQIAVLLGLGYGAGRAIGLGSTEALFLGAAVAQSSSTVMTKIVSERGEEPTDHARIAVTWAVVQDLSTILLVVLLGVIARQDVNAGDLAVTALKVGGFLFCLLVIGVRVVPWALDQVAAVRSREVFLLAIASLALGVAAAAAALEISLALGAFLAGVVVSESARSEEVLDELLPARDVFAVLFFVSIGMLIDVGGVAEHMDVFAVSLTLIVAAKFAFVTGPLVIVGRPLRTAMLAGILLAQSAELTFVILDAGVADHAVSAGLFSTVVTAVGCSILLTPVLVRLGWPHQTTIAAVGSNTKPWD